MPRTAARLRSCMPSASDSTASRMAAASVPNRMKGVRLPRRLRHLSEIAPKSGSMNSASTLSSAMMIPLLACDMPNLSVRILGMMASYACQNAQMRKNANPTNSVRR